VVLYGTCPQRCSSVQYTQGSSWIHTVSGLKMSPLYLTP